MFARHIKQADEGRVISILAVWITAPRSKNRRFLDRRPASVTN